MKVTKAWDVSPRAGLGSGSSLLRLVSAGALSGGWRSPPRGAFGDDFWGVLQWNEASSVPRVPTLEASEPEPRHALLIRGTMYLLL